MSYRDYFRVAAAVPRVRVGSCDDNCASIERLVRSAASQGVEVVVTPELSITGYTCGDLFLQSSLVSRAAAALEALIDRLSDLDIVVIVGLPLRLESKLYNCAVVFSRGSVLATVPKVHLPNYSEFYEARWFSSGAKYPLTDRFFEVNGVRCCVELCEDLWVSNPPSSQVAGVAQVCFNLSASPEVVGKHDYLVGLVEQQSARCIGGYVYASAGFGESSTDLVFGGSCFIAENGRLLARGERFAIDEQLVVADLDIELLDNHRARTSTFGTAVDSVLFGESHVSPCSSIHFGVDKTLRGTLLRAVDRSPFVPSDLSLRDCRCEEIFAIQSGGLVQRLSHTASRSVVLGISGGLDSTLALLVCVRAFDRLGLDRRGIVGVTMPGFGTTDRTYGNAVAMMELLGVTVREVSIMAACEQHFSDIGLPADDRSVSYENSQARERTQILMDIANMEGGFVVGTGDLSELALGWATYNGDHMSMYGVNSSVPKTLVRYLVEWVADGYRAGGDERLYSTLLDVIATPVSPELLPATDSGVISQRTEDLVGPYELHDFFLYHFVRNCFGPRKIYDLALVAFCGVYEGAVILRWLRTFVRRFFSQQFKRSAMPDGPKVGSVSLSPRGDWRMPSDAVVEEWLSELDF